MDALELLTMLGANKELTQKQLKIITKLKDACEQIPLKFDYEIIRIQLHTELIDGILEDYITLYISHIQYNVLERFGFDELVVFYTYRRAEYSPTEPPFVLSLSPDIDMETERLESDKLLLDRTDNYIAHIINHMNAETHALFNDAVSMYRPILELIGNSHLLNR